MNVYVFVLVCVYVHELQNIFNSYAEGLSF